LISHVSFLIIQLLLIAGWYEKNHNSPKSKVAEYLGKHIGNQAKLGRVLII